MNKISILATAIALCVSAQAVANKKQEEANTYSELQTMRGLSVEKQGSLTQEQLDQAKLIHRNKILELNNQYELLIIESNKIRNQGSIEKKEAAAPVSSEERLAKYRMEQRQRDEAKNKAELEALIVEIEKQIFITDIHEIAGKTKGEFWHQGSVQTLSEGDTFGDWYVKELTFNGAIVVPYNLEKKSISKSGTKHIALMTPDEAISRFKTGQQFRDTLLKQKMEALTGATTANPYGFQAPQLINNSPTSGLMFQ